MTAAIELEDVTVRYGDVTALEHATLAIEPGRVCGLVGVNGSGKSTMLRAIMGQRRPDFGVVRVDGETPATARKRGRIGYVPQSEDIDPSFPISVREVVMMGRYRHMGLTRRPRRSDQAAVDEALERVELSDLGERQIGQLSGGQRKRAFVARGIAQGASVLLLDEPFAGVDQRSVALITRLLRELSDESVTVLVSTHDLPALPDLADEAILLKRRVLLHADPREVIRPENLARAFGLDGASSGEER